MASPRLRPCLLRRPPAAVEAAVDRPAAAGTSLPLSIVDRTKVVPLGERGEVAGQGSAGDAGLLERPRGGQPSWTAGCAPATSVYGRGRLLFLVDRIKDLIICSGFNVYPRTIEEALCEHPAVEENNSSACPTSIAAKRRWPS